MHKLKVGDIVEITRKKGFIFWDIKQGDKGMINRHSGMAGVYEVMLFANERRQGLAYNFLESELKKMDER